jgi:DNA-binding response OmpR family regulator
MTTDCCRKAREMSELTTFDIFVIDSELPDCKGHELAKDLWVMTGRASIIVSKMQCASLPEGAHTLGSFRKPYHASELVDLVRCGLDGQGENLQSR